MLHNVTRHSSDGCIPVRMFLLIAVVLVYSRFLSEQTFAQKLRDSVVVSFRTFSTPYDTPPFSLTTVITPQFIQQVRALRAFLRDDRFAAIKRTFPPAKAVDVLYQKALILSNGDCGRALALCLFSVLEHRTLQFKVPLLSFISFPLTFEDDSLFLRRIQNLPSHFFSDSYRYPDADRDKLQHFFASAFIAYSAETSSIVPFLGSLTEWFEEHCIVGGSDDWRDKAANELGNAFGMALIVDPTVLPSEYLTLPLEPRK